jgi:tetratricopeptide (TPR) repeat protein
MRATGSASFLDRVLAVRGLGYTVALLVALVLRILYLLEYAGSPLCHVAIGPDIHEYHVRALAVLGGRVLQGEPWVHGPVYPLFHALLLWGLRHRLVWVRVVQVLLELLCGVWLTWVLHRGGRRREAHWCAWLWAVCASLVYYSAEFYAEGLCSVFLCLSLGGVILVLGRDREPTRVSWVCLGLCGLAAGFAVLTHPLALPAGLLSAWVCWWTTRRRSVAGSAAFAVGLVLPLALVMGWYGWRSGRPVLVQERSGLNFYIGNGPGADGTCRVRPGPEYDALVSRGQASGEGDRWYWGRSLAHIAAEPGAWYRVVVRKLVLSVSGADIASSADLRNLRDATVTMRLLGWSTGLILVLAGLGTLLAAGRGWSRDEVRLLWPCLAVSVGYSIGLVLFVTAGRYRVPMLPSLIVLGAFGGARLVELFRSADRAGLTGAALAVLALIVLVVVPRAPCLDQDRLETDLLRADAAVLVGDVREGRRLAEALVSREPNRTAPLHVLVRAALREGDHAGALEWAERILDRRPRDAMALVNAGVACRGLGLEDRAEDCFRSAIEVAPGTADAWYNLGVLLESQGAAQEALGCYARAASEYPGLSSAHLNIGVLLLRKGHTHQAERAYERALRLAPRHPGVLNGLAVIRARQGRRREALALFRRSLRVAPEQPEVKAAIEELANGSRS